MIHQPSPNLSAGNPQIWPFLMIIVSTCLLTVKHCHWAPILPSPLLPVSPLLEQPLAYRDTTEFSVMLVTPHQSILYHFGQCVHCAFLGPPLRKHKYFIICCNNFFIATNNICNKYYLLLHGIGNQVFYLLITGFSPWCTLK